MGYLVAWTSLVNSEAKATVRSPELESMGWGGLCVNVAGGQLAMKEVGSGGT